MAHGLLVLMPSQKVFFFTIENGTIATSPAAGPSENRNTEPD